MGLLRARLAWALSTYRSLIRRTRTGRRSRRAMRWRAAAVVMLVFSVGHPLAALAADGLAPNPFLDPWGIKDSSGVPISAFGLNYDTTGFLESATLGPAIFFANLAWNGYIMIFSVIVWLFQWSTQLQILDLLDPVATTVASVLATTIGRLALVALATALGVIGALGAMHRGHIARGFLEIFLAMLVATAAAQNVGAVIMADLTIPGGTIHQAKDLGNEIAADIATGGARTSSGDTNTSSVQEIEKTSAKLADALVRAPHQILQYGAVLDTEDSGQCSDTYTDAMKTGGGGNPDTTKAVTDCNEKYKASVQDPMTALMGMAVVLPAGLGSLVPLIVLLVGFNAAVGWALIESVHIIWALVQGILPGSGRTQLLVRAMSILMALVVMVATLAAVGITAVIIESVLTAGAKTLGAVPTFVVLLITMTIATAFLIACLWQSRKTARKAAERLGKSIAPQSTSMASSAPKINAGTLIKPAAAMWAMNRATHPRPTATANGQRSDDTKSSGGLNPAHAAGRLARGTGKAAAAGTSLALKSTIGAPVYLPRAVGAAKTSAANAKARTRSAITDKLQAARLRGTQAQDKAKAFGNEYTSNLKAGAAWMNKKTTPPTRPTIQEQTHPKTTTQTPAKPPAKTAAKTAARAQANARPGLRPSQPTGRTPPAASSPIHAKPSRAKKKMSLNEQHLAATQKTTPPPPAPAISGKSQ